MAGRVSDWYFSNGKDFDGVTEQIDDVRGTAAAEPAAPSEFGLNGFMIVRDTEAEARDTCARSSTRRTSRRSRASAQAVKQAGAVAAGQEGHVGGLQFEDLVQYNDGFRTS